MALMRQVYYCQMMPFRLNLGGSAFYDGAAGCPRERRSSSSSHIAALTSSALLERCSSISTCSASSMVRGFKPRGGDLMTTLYRATGARATPLRSVGVARLSPRGNQARGTVATYSTGGCYDKAKARIDDWASCRNPCRRTQGSHRADRCARVERRSRRLALLCNKGRQRVWTLYPRSTRLELRVRFETQWCSSSHSSSPNRCCTPRASRRRYQCNNICTLWSGNTIRLSGWSSCMFSSRWWTTSPGSRGRPRCHSATAR